MARAFNLTKSAGARMQWEQTQHEWQTQECLLLSWAAAAPSEFLTYDADADDP
jgi:hypothetical protein